MYKQISAWNTEYKADATFLLFPSDEFGGQELPAEEIAPFLQGFKLTKVSSTSPSPTVQMSALHSFLGVCP